MNALRRRWKTITLAAAILTMLPFVTLLTWAALTSLPAELRDAPRMGSIEVRDRDGRLLRETRDGDGTRSRFVPLAETGLARDAVLAAEDRRFYRHHGVDPIAVLRAVVSNVRRLRVVSGASTITMQLARTLRPHEKTLFGKLSEMALAIRIDAEVPKDRVLEEYLNRVSFGPNMRGIAAASHAYFGKAPKDLSLAEAALLAGVVRGPTLYAPDRSPERAKARRAFVLARMRQDGVLDEDRFTQANGEPVATVSIRPAFGAPHFVDGLVKSASAKRLLATTLDGRLQRETETVVRVVLDRLAERHVTAAAVVVLDNETREVLAYVGSPDVFDASRLGANDGVVAKRQPGSALKPFLYALAMETHGFTPATVLPDIPLLVPSGGGTWAPHNYDSVFHGPVRLREALGSSLNVPAAWTIGQVGTGRFLDRLRALGFDTLTESPEFYGPALALGDGEVRLIALTNAYATLARGGLHRAPRMLRAIDDAPVSRMGEVRVFPAHVAAMVVDALKDRNARIPAFGDATPFDFPYEVAAKTGTSKGFRDNWALGFSSAVTVGVWVGNFDGSPMQEVSGITGAGPIFQGVMEAAMRTRAPSPLVIAHDETFVPVELCALSGHRATPMCPGRVKESLPESVARSLPFDTWHVAVRIDRRNGLRAGPGCSAAETESRIYERLPPEYVAWATAAKRPLYPESSPLCPAEESGPAPSSIVRLRAPLDGSKWVLDPERPANAQKVEVEVVAPPGANEVDLFADGLRVATLKRPFVYDWTPILGAHAFVAVVKGLPPSQPVRLEVRD